jgi:cell division protease FtsH
MLWMLMFLLLFGLYWLSREGPATKIPYSELKAQIRADNVATVTFRGRTITGTFEKPLPETASAQSDGEAEGAGQATGQKPAQSAPTGSKPQGQPSTQDAGQDAEKLRFTTQMPEVDDPELLELLEQHGVSVSAEPEDSGWWQSVLIMLLPLLLILGLFAYGGSFLRRQLGGMGDRISGFGQSKAKRFERGTSDVGFDDVAGLVGAKRELREIVDFLTDPSRFRKLGAKSPKGVLLMGPPGTGKTLLARAVAGEADVPFFSITGSEFVEMFVGVGASRVRDMFETAKRDAPAILFIDEIDSVGRMRGAGLGGGHDEREQTLNQILSEMDGFSPNEAIVVMAATNRPDVLDPALLRPGRFDRKITLELPQRAAREKILEVHVRGVPVAGDVDLADLAVRTVGFSGADLENLVNEAALLAVRGKADEVTRDHFERARDRILLGGEREDLIVEKEKHVVATHESGHALVARLLPGTDPLKKVTIIPRGRSLGATEQAPDEDRHNLPRSYLTARIAVLLGGRTAERVVFDEITTGAEDDLKQVTQLARRMVTQWGMSERLGTVAFRHGEEHPFLGREMSQPRDFSEATAQIIDEEIRTIVREGEERAERVLTEHRDLLDRLAEALLEHETLDAAEIDRVLGLDEGPVGGQEDAGGSERRSGRTAGRQPTTAPS